MSTPINHISTLPAGHTITVTDPAGTTVAAFTLTQPAQLTITQQSVEPNNVLRMQHVGTYTIDPDNLDDTVPEVAQLHDALDAFLAATGAADDDGTVREMQRDNEYSDEAFKDLESLRKHAAPRKVPSTQGRNQAAQNPTENFGRITIITDTSSGDVQFVDRCTQQVINDADFIETIMLAYEHRLHVHATFRVPDRGLVAYQGRIEDGDAYGKNPYTIYVIDPRIGGAEVITPDVRLAPDMHHLVQLTIYSDTRAKECVDTTPPLDIAAFADIVLNNASVDTTAAENAAKDATRDAIDGAPGTPATLTSADLEVIDTVMNNLVDGGVEISRGAQVHADRYHMCALRTSHGDFVDVSYINDRYSTKQILNILADAADDTLSVIAMFALPYGEETYIGKLKWNGDETELYIDDKTRGDVDIAYINNNDEFCAEDVVAQLSCIRVFSDMQMRRNGFAGTNDAQYDLVRVAAFRDKL